jgi:hypothetical protein
LSSALLRCVLVFLGLLLAIPLACQPGFAQSSPPNRKVPPPPPAPPATDQEQFISYWTTETGWHTELQLRNNQASNALTVTPVLRAQDGTETALSPVTIMPQEVKSLDIDAAIAAAGAPQLVGTYGSVVLRYRSSTYSGLYAVAMVMGVGHPIAFHIDGTGELDDYPAGSREGIWWLPNSSASDYLILVNKGKSALPLVLSLFDSGGKASTQHLILAPAAASRLSVRQLVTFAGLTGSYGGIQVSATNHAESLNTLHVVFDENANFSAILKMFDHGPNAKLAERDFAHTGTWTLRAPMLALSNPDPALAFPVGTILRPRIFIRNAMGKPVGAALRFNWRGNNTTGKALGPQLHLFPYETRLVDVAALQNGIVLPKNATWASVTLTSNALPDELLAVAASYDQTLKYGAQTPFSDQLSHQWKGGMWEFDPYHSSIITAGNGGTKPTQAAFTIFYNQGTQKYQLEQTLQPDEQMWMDIGKLIREKVPDKNGKTLPADLTSGSYEFRDLTNNGVGTLFEGKVIYDKTYGHVTYGCATCCGYNAAELWYDPILLGYQGPPVLDGVYGFNVCDQQWEDVSSAYYGNWSSLATSIITVDTYGSHTPHNVGSTTTNTFGYIESTAHYPICPATYRSPGGGANTDPTVTIGLFSQNPILQGSTATVTITVNPSATISLAITSTGTGTATFDGQGGSTTKTLSGTTTVTIYGSAVSTNSYDLTLSASYNGTPLGFATFSVTSGACTLGGENDTGSGKHACPSTVTLQSTYTISQYCSTCQFQCTSVITDGSWTPNINGCSTVNSHFVGSLTGTATTAATGTFSATDCSWHYVSFVTTVTNAQNVRTNDTGGQIGIECQNSQTGYPCP